jgi:hypothetical protein
MQAKLHRESRSALDICYRGRGAINPCGHAGPIATYTKSFYPEAQIKMPDAKYRSRKTVHKTAQKIYQGIAR